jgi:hypothetical protein
MRDIVSPEAVFLFLGIVTVMMLFRIASLLGGIRAILADIAAATRATANRGMTETSKYETQETNKLLKLAIRKHWGSAIDLGDERSMAVNPTPAIHPPSPDAPLGVWLAYRADLQPLADLPGIVTFIDEADAPSSGCAIPNSPASRRTGPPTTKPRQSRTRTRTRATGYRVGAAQRGPG